MPTLVSSPTVARVLSANQVGCCPCCSCHTPDKKPESPHGDRGCSPQDPDSPSPARRLCTGTDLLFLQAQAGAPRAAVFALPSAWCCSPATRIADSHFLYVFAHIPAPRGPPCYPVPFPGVFSYFTLFPSIRNTSHLVSVHPFGSRHWIGSSRKAAWHLLAPLLGPGFAYSEQLLPTAEVDI